MTLTAQFKTIQEAFQVVKSASTSIHFIKSKDTVESLTYAQLYQESLTYLYAFQKQGLKKGDELIFQVEDNKAFVLSFWACILGGIIPVPLNMAANEEQKRKFVQVWNTLQNPHVLVSDIFWNRLQLDASIKTLSAQIDAKRVSIDTLDLSGEGKTELVSADDTAFIQFSSGSTAAPKGVILTQSNLLHNVEAILNGIEASDNESSLSWMPLTHDMGLIGMHITPTLLMVEQRIMPTALFVRNPKLWLEIVTEHKVTVTSSPNFGYRHFLKNVSTEQRADLELSSLRVIFNGAEPISPDVVREFNTEMKIQGLAPTAMLPVYGLAEASLAVSFSKIDGEMETCKIARGASTVGEKVNFREDDSVELVSAGKPVKFSEIQITNENGAEVGENEMGEILIKGPNVTKRYYNDVAPETFQNDWVKTGDIGFVHEGNLYISGRKKEIIFVNGQNIYPYDLEDLLIEAGIAEAGKVALCGVKKANTDTDTVLAFIDYKKDLGAFEDIAKQVKTELTEKAAIVVNHVIPIKTIPKTSSGKIQRVKLGQEFLEGNFNTVLAEMEALKAPVAAVEGGASQIENDLLEICNEVLPDKNIGRTDNIFEMGTSSLLLAQIYDKLNDKYPDKMEITDFFDYPTIAEVAAYLEGQK